MLPTQRPENQWAPQQLSSEQAHQLTIRLLRLQAYYMHAPVLTVGLLLVVVCAHVYAWRCFCRAIQAQYNELMHDPPPGINAGKAVLVSVCTLHTAMPARSTRQYTANPLAEFLPPLPHLTHAHLLAGPIDDDWFDWSAVIQGPVRVLLGPCSWGPLCQQQLARQGPNNGPPVNVLYACSNVA